MKNYRVFIKKEITEGLRTHKFLVIGIAILFFAVLDPVMIKLLPKIMQNQMKGIDLTKMFEVSTKIALQQYLKDIFQIGMLVFVLSLSGIISTELKNKTLVVPIAMGGNRSSVLLAKFSVYGIYIFIFNLLGISVAYGYAKLIIKDNYTNYKNVILTGAIYGLFFIFVLALVIFFSSIFNKGYITGILTLVLTYGLSLLDNLKQVNKFIPHHILSKGNKFESLHSISFYTPLSITIIIIIVCLVLAMLKLNKTDLL